jgi:uncharacterized membrane protein YgcG
MPEACVHDISAAKDAFESLDGHAINMDINVLKIGESVQIPQGPFRVFSFPTTHRVPSQGYCIAQQHRGPLLPEYADAEPSTYKKLRKAGVEPFHLFETCELAYTGDTTFEGLLAPELEFLFTVPILIIEMTYLDGERSKASLRGHIHLDDFLENEHLFQNEKIIFMHLSEKYTPHTRALRILRERVPSYLHHRIGVCLRSFGADEDITYLFPADDGGRANGYGRSNGGDTKQIRHSGSGSGSGTRSFGEAMAIGGGGSSGSSSSTGRAHTPGIQVMCSPCVSAESTGGAASTHGGAVAGKSSNKTRRKEAKQG